jgi:hypothetical protein
MADSMPEAVTFNKRRLVSPYLFAAGLVVAVVYRGDYYLLFCLMGVYLGWACSSPNLNLADGFLAQIALVLGILLSRLNAHLWYVGLCCWLTWLAASVELGLKLTVMTHRRHRAGQ